MDDINTLGLLVGYIASLTNLSHNLISGLTHLMKNMSSVERLREYATNTEFEEPWYLTGKGSSHYEDYSSSTVKQGSQNPEMKELSPIHTELGKIALNNVNIRYRPGLKLVLKKLSLNILKGEKVAIVGRTGSGKSTLVLALTRILELQPTIDEEDSNIFVNGFDI